MTPGEESTGVYATKAETLRKLANADGAFVVDPFVAFTVSEWFSDRGVVLGRIQSDPELGEVVIVRSSGLDEAGAQPKSWPGAYRSVLRVRRSSASAVAQAVDAVIESYGKRPEGAFASLGDEVIVQRQVLAVQVAGVMTTRDPRTGGPYVHIEYDESTGRTDSVTSGADCDRVSVLRGYRADDSRWALLAGHAMTVERILGTTDIIVEFAVDRDGATHIFQAWARNRRDDPVPFDGALRRALHDGRRRIRRNGQTIWSDMADWNPAEMLGSQPAALDRSIYEALITNRTWADARTQIGYIDARPQRLMHVFIEKPYIDVRTSFRSLTPSALDPDLAYFLLADRIEYLKSNPHLHDKVEIEVFPSAPVLDAARMFGQGTMLSQGQQRRVRQAVSSHASYLLDSGHDLIRQGVAQSGTLVTRHSSHRRICSVRDVVSLLNATRRFGTLPFARVARLAFVARSLMFQLERMGALSPEAMVRFWHGLGSSATSVATQARRAASGEDAQAAFLSAFGHLRPRTYDITSRRYLDEPPVAQLAEDRRKESALGRNLPLISNRERRDICRILGGAGLACDADTFLGLARASLAARERVKLNFSVSLSAALEGIAGVAQAVELERDDIRHMRVQELRLLHEAPEVAKAIIARRRLDREVASRAVLPAVISNEQSLLEVHALAAQPNFVTSKRVLGPVVPVGPERRSMDGLQGAIVAIEAADPGFDWIFACDIGGLVTSFGGAASHMAIRCAEFDIPAAIGCGELIFERLLTSSHALLDCEHRVVRSADRISNEDSDFG